MTEVIMPKMGDGMEEGTLLEWLKKEGDQVKSGEVIGTIQTDKATLELEAPGTGKLTGILLESGGTVPVGRPIAAIVKEGEALPAGWGGKDAPTGDISAKAEPAQVIEAAPSSNGKREEAPMPTIELESRIKASPLAKKIAREKSIDLSTLKGSGPGGRIVEKDVQLVQSEEKKAPVFVEQKADVEDKIISLPRLRQITATRTTQSKQQVPHFYVTVEVDVEKIVQLREMFASQNSGKISINDFVVSACAKALQDMPEVNATYEGQTVRQYSGIHIGIAAAVPDGLTVPVIKNTDKLSLRQISSSAKTLVQKAKENKLGMDEVTGSTFSISNMGMLDVDNFVAIINQPNAAILAIASVRKKVVVSESGEIVVADRMNITCSFDHRVVDGAVGAKFINLVRDYLQNPTRLLG